MFAVTQRWGSMTPFGAAVLPLVNCRIASESGSSTGRAYASAPRVATAARSSSSVTIGGSSGSGVRNASSCASATTTRHSAFAIRTRVCSTKSSMEAIRIGSGSMTTLPPASQVAWMAVTRSRLVGPISPTLLPGSTPRAWSSAAIARASSWIRAHCTASVEKAALSEAPVTKVTERRQSAAASRRGTSVEGLVRGFIANVSTGT